MSQQLNLMLGIKVVGGFIQDEYLGILSHSPGKQRPLFFSTGEQPKVVILEVD
ncbi:hypothetical protein IAE39_000038 [Pseudomonas sp. S37]|nr:hypothetical protein [Pseudomonas sp. S36]MBK4991864.1 hypothetical protein [Pseudomonas sp. S37]MBK5006356.1 hypothetical protein [Pseudomonas sp. S32]MBK5009479.1 hypothetical protein [Pseudomonas sp. S60]